MTSIRVCGVALLSVLATAPAFAEDDIGTYGLDDVSREVAPTGRLACPEVDLVTYRGTHVKYHKPLKVYSGFKPRLVMFEQVVRDTAIDVYGRAPTTIRHFGTYNCRRIGRYPHLISEHGLGNGIDVAAFQFPRLKKGAKAPDGLPKRLRRGFTTTVLKHWDATGAVGATHSRFLKLLAKRLVAREDIFRVLLGPSYPGHKNHFHFDCANFRLVVI